MRIPDWDLILRYQQQHWIWDRRHQHMYIIILNKASVDGRACILDINQRLVVSSKLVFKVYKVDEEGRGYRSEKIQKYYSVNSMQINHRGRSLWLSTTGSEGSVTFWDIEKKNKILNLTFDKAPVTTSQLSPDGQCMAFGLGYDWSRGLDGVGEYSSRVGVI